MRIVIFFQDYCTRIYRFFRQPPTLLAVVAFVCMHHTTAANKLPTSASNSQQFWANNVVTCCVRLHEPKSLTSFKLYATSANIVVVQCKRTQHAEPNNVASVSTLPTLGQTKAVVILCQAKVYFHYLSIR